MPDVVRDMSLWIACEVDKEKENFLVYAGVQLRKMPDVRNWKDERKISLMQNEIISLSRTPRCPHLITLFLGSNRLTVSTSDFFDFMPSLKVLNLSKNPSLAELPSGISKLVSLQYLNLSETSIKELPIELNALTNLKCLNLEHTRSLLRIPRQLICNFSGLLVLRMLDCGSVRTLLEEDSVLFGGREILVEELIRLENLNVLSVTLTSFCSLQNILSSQMFQSCTKALELRCCEDSKSLKILSLAQLKCLEKLDFTYCFSLEEMMIETGRTRDPYVFSSLRRVTIDACDKLRELTWLGYAPNLKTVHVERCYGMEEIISDRKLGKDNSALNPFTKLQYLRLKVLTNLKKIYWRSLPFQKLLKLFVYECPKFNKLRLDFNSAKERKLVIRGKQQWWNELTWDDEATLNAFLPCFESF